jgi:hypothetical protein
MNVKMRNAVLSENKDFHLLDWKQPFLVRLREGTNEGTQFILTKNKMLLCHRVN